MFPKDIQINYNDLPIFTKSDIQPDLSLEYFDRSVAVIQIIKENRLIDQYVTYDRTDNLWRFPGGHVDPGENIIQTAVRETKEEIGLDGLEFSTYIGSAHNFYWHNDKPSHVIEHYLFFTVNFSNWQNKAEDEKGMFSVLKSKDEILGNNWPQVKWVFDRISDLEIN